MRLPRAMIYFAILLTLALFALVHDVLKVRRGRRLSYWGAYIGLVCLAGFRYKVGGDTYNYMYMHELLPNLSGIFNAEVGIEKLQPLWLLFSATAKSIDDAFYVLQFLHAAIVNWVIFDFIRKNSNYRQSAVLVYYFSIYPFLNFEILREALAICCFLISIRYYVNRVWWRYYALATVALLFHFSAIFLFLLPMIRDVRLTPMRLVMVFVLATLLNPLVMAAVTSATATRLLGFALKGYEEYEYTFFGLLSILVLYFLVPLALTWISQRWFKVEARYGVVAQRGLLVGACIPLFFIFYRFFNYFALLYMLAAVDVIHGVINNSSLRRLKPIAVPALFCVTFAFATVRYFQDTSHLAEGTRWYNRWFPYHSVFDPVSFPPREVMIESQNRDTYEKSR